jgi:glycosyltransferase involved in cell wall biosynthesis
MTRPLQILFLDQYGGMGGGQRILLSLVEAAHGHNVTVMAPDGGSLEAALARQAPKVRYRHFEEPAMRHGRKGIGDVARLLRFAWRFRHQLPLLRQQDVIHVNGLRHLPHMLLWSLAGRLARARVIYHIHLDHSRTEKLLLRLAAAMPATFRLIANSGFVRSRLGFSSKKIVLVENALDDAFAALPFTDRFAGPPHAAVIGTLRPEKGQDIAMAAVPAAMALHMIGPDGDGAGPWIAAIKARAPAHISFDGPVADVPQALVRLGIQYNLVPSRWDEPFGLVAIEGMACSCLTIVSGRGGLADIAAATGALVARDETELAQCLTRLEAATVEERANLARAQHQTTQTRYAPARFRAEIRALFDAAVQS